MEKLNLFWCQKLKCMHSFIMLFSIAFWRPLLWVCCSYFTCPPPTKRVLRITDINLICMKKNLPIKDSSTLRPNISRVLLWSRRQMVPLLRKITALWTPDIRSQYLNGVILSFLPKYTWYGINSLPSKPFVHIAHFWPCCSVLLMMGTKLSTDAVPSQGWWDWRRNRWSCMACSQLTYRIY